MSQLDGQVAIVTGSARGIGRAIAHRLAAERADVIVADIDVAGAGTAAMELGESGYRAHAIGADMGDPAAIRRLFDEVAKRYGHLEILINNAGIPGFAPLEALDVPTWDRVLAVNLRGPLLCAQAAAPLMRRGQGGAIVNIASTRALMSEPGNEAYAASKGGMLALTQALANSLAPAIRVNAICPGWIAPPGESLRPVDHAQHLVGRVGRPEDIAEACLFLASRAAGFVTGQTLVVDGGMTRKMIYAE